MTVDMSKEELEEIGFRSIKENKCECDCMIGTCSDCFLRGKMKPWCENCHSDINDGKCCDNQKSYIKEGWIDVTPHIVKHTDEEKKVIYKRIDAHNKMLTESDEIYRRGWQTKTCKCGKDFSSRGGIFETCKDCTMKLMNNHDEYRETDLQGAHYNF